MPELFDTSWFHHTYKNFCVKYNGFIVTLNIFITVIFKHEFLPTYSTETAGNLVFIELNELSDIR